MKSLYFGFNPPFFKNGNVLPVQTDERLIKNDLLQLILTSPGERVFRPDFGTDINNQLFDPIDDFALTNIKRSIAKAIDLYEPRVKVTDIRIDRKDDDNMITVQVFAALTNDRNRVLTLDVSIPVGPAPSPAPPQQLT